MSVRIRRAQYCFNCFMPRMLRGILELMLTQRNWKFCGHHTNVLPDGSAAAQATWDGAGSLSIFISSFRTGGFPCSDVNQGAGCR